MGISVILLAHKEEENLRVLLPRLESELSKISEEKEILVIDTQMPLDNTEAVCVKFGARYIPQEEEGYAGAFRTGIRYATMDKFLNLDSDGAHPPEAIGEMYKKFVNIPDEASSFDMVIGSRYVSGGKTQDSISSIIMSKVLNFVMQIVLGVSAKDISTSFRIYDTAQLKKVVLKRRNFDVLQEVIMRMKLNNRNFTIGEVPIQLGKRIHGLSTRKLLIYIASYVCTVFILIGLRIRGAFNEYTKS